MELRVTRMAENAQSIAEFLEQHPKIKSVRFPGLPSHPDYEIAKKQMVSGGTSIGFEFGGSQKEAFAFMDALTVIDISNNLGDSKSLITHPASTTHRRLTTDVQAEMGITPSVLRLSVGLEHVNDLIKDLTQALSN
jgi:O-succinylhomoserine sulfhydrylase